ncbi:MAG: hypothetical protein V4565_11080 [Bacteroidota bacterium]
MENTESHQQPVRKSKWKKWLSLTLLTLVLISIIYVVICGMSYSTGTRTGVVIKLSRKGYIFKTYEGELNLGGVTQGDGTLMPTRLWNFSVKGSNDSIYNAITANQGKQVRLHYKEVYKTFFWQSETPYLIEKVEVVN